MLCSEEIFYRSVAQFTVFTLRSLAMLSLSLSESSKKLLTFFFRCSSTTCCFRACSLSDGAWFDRLRTSRALLLRLRPSVLVKLPGTAIEKLPLAETSDRSDPVSDGSSNWNSFFDKVMNSCSSSCEHVGRIAGSSRRQSRMKSFACGQFRLGTRFHTICSVVSGAPRNPISGTRPRNSGKGNPPDMISHKRQPSAQTSAACVALCPSSSSGAMKDGVPAMPPWSLSICVAQPKSATFAMYPDERRMLADLMSRWTTSWLCRYSMPRSTSFMKAAASDGSKGSSLMSFCRQPSVANSMKTCSSVSVRVQ
eukprot:PhM_4_TR15888/c3_g1_i1/m.16915